MAHWSIWIPGLIVAVSNFLDITPWPQTRKSTPACFMLWIKAIFRIVMAVPESFEGRVVQSDIRAFLMEDHDEFSVIGRHAALGERVVEA